MRNKFEKIVDTIVALIIGAAVVAALATAADHYRQTCQPGSSVLCAKEVE